MRESNDSERKTRAHESGANACKRKYPYFGYTAKRNAVRLTQRNYTKRQALINSISHCRWEATHTLKKNTVTLIVVANSLLNVWTDVFFPAGMMWMTLSMEWSGWSVLFNEDTRLSGAWHARFGRRAARDCRLYAIGILIWVARAGDILTRI